MACHSFCSLRGELDMVKDEQEGTITKERVKFSKEIKVCLYLVVCFRDMDVFKFLFASSYAILSI